MGRAAALALKLSVLMTQNGAIPVAPQSWLLLPISARRIMLFQTTMAAGVTLLGATSTSPCPCSLKSPNTVPELFPSLTAGELVAFEREISIIYLCNFTSLNLPSNVGFNYAECHAGSREESGSRSTVSVTSTWF